MAEFRAVVAIDFGTSRSGFAYAFPSDDGSNPDIMTKVYPEDGYRKQPSCLYVDMPTSSLLALGHEAREMYARDHQLDPGLESKKMFEFFKRGLEGDAASSKVMWAASDSGITIEDDFVPVESSVAEISVHTLITMTLRHIKDEVLSYIAAHDGILLSANHIKWVITLPAIWSEEAKFAMKEAACSAGLVQSVMAKELLLALEPECALIGVTRELGPLLPSMVGETVMIVDCGGGTVDMTVVTIESANPFKCAHALMSSGGWWGSTTIDDELEMFIKLLLGPKLYNAFRSSEIARMSMMSAWELYKKTFKSSSELPFDCRLDFLDDMETDGVSLKLLVSKFKSVKNERWGSACDKLASRSYVVIVPPALVKKFFDVPMKYIVEHIGAQGLVSSDSKKCKPLKYIVLAGGFSESPYLQEVVGAAFPEIQLIASHNSGSRIQTGAVMFGLIPETITSRIMRGTFGYDVCIKREHFKGNCQGRTFVHEENQVEYVMSCFRVFVEKGKTVSFAEEICQSVFPMYESQTETSVNIYYTAKTSIPLFCDDAGVKKIGSFAVKVRKASSSCQKVDRAVNMTFRFGLTSLEVSAKAVGTGDVANIKIKLSPRV